MFSNICMCADPDCTANGCRRQRIREDALKHEVWYDYKNVIRPYTQTKDNPNSDSVEDLAGELEINEDTLAILAVAQMQMSKGFTAEDLIKRLLTEPS